MIADILGSIASVVAILTSAAAALGWVRRRRMRTRSGRRTPRGGVSVELDAAERGRM